MFCPKCATQNLEGASYCRSCGANISLVPHALTGQLPQTAEPEIYGGRRGRWRREATIESAFKSAFMGVAFLLISVALSFSNVGSSWWFWMLIPAFSMMGSGVAQYIRVREQGRRTLPGAKLNKPVGPSPSRAELFAAPRTGELLPTPASVTEGTTRHLGAEAVTKHLEASGDSN